jgi:hypothetical protein
VLFMAGRRNSMDVMREGPHINVTDGLPSSKARLYKDHHPNLVG